MWELCWGGSFLEIRKDMWRRAQGTDKSKGLVDQESDVHRVYNTMLKTSAKSADTLQTY